MQSYTSSEFEKYLITVEAICCLLSDDAADGRFFAEIEPSQKNSVSVVSIIFQRGSIFQRGFIYNLKICEK